MGTMNLLGVQQLLAQTYTFAFDVASSTSGTGTSLAWSHTVTTNQGNRAIYVAVSFQDASVTVSSVVRNGQSFTSVGSVRSSSNYTEIFRLLAPTTGAYSITVTLSGTPSGGNWKAGAWSFTGVNQSAPNGTLVSGGSVYGGPAMTLTIGAAVGDICIMASNTNGEWYGTIDGTTDWNLGTGICAAGSHLTATSTSQNMTHNIHDTAQDSYSMAGVAVKPN